MVRPTDAFIGTHVGQVRNDNGLELHSLIPAGKFTLGSPTDEKNRGSDEDQVQVTLTKGFWLGQHEVTQGEWHRVMQTTPWSGRRLCQRG